MSRLTKKYEDDSGYEPIENHNVCNVTLYDFNVDDYDLCVDKLGRLEDLEDELGCSLEVVFEALMKGIIVPECDAWFPTVGLEKSKIDDDWGLSAHSIFLTLKDYKKTWWLPRDEEWKDEK